MFSPLIRNVTCSKCSMKNCMSIYYKENEWEVIKNSVWMARENEISVKWTWEKNSHFTRENWVRFGGNYLLLHWVCDGKETKAFHLFVGFCVYSSVFQPKGKCDFFLPRFCFWLLFAVTLHCDGNQKNRNIANKQYQNHKNFSSINNVLNSTEPFFRLPGISLE